MPVEREPPGPGEATLAGHEVRHVRGRREGGRPHPIAAG